MTSISADQRQPGTVRYLQRANGHLTKANELLAKARSRTDAERQKMAALVSSWRISHPTHADVAIFGDMAIVKRISAKSGASNVTSCDIFIYRDGRWRAAYSQHSFAS